MANKKYKPNFVNMSDYQKAHTVPVTRDEYTGKKQHLVSYDEYMDLIGTVDRFRDAEDQSRRFQQMWADKQRKQREAKQAQWNNTITRMNNAQNFANKLNEKQQIINSFMNKQAQEAEQERKAQQGNSYDSFKSWKNQPGTINNAGVKTNTGDMNDVLSSVYNDIKGREKDTQRMNERLGNVYNNIISKRIAKDQTQAGSTNTQTSGQKLVNKPEQFVLAGNNNTQTQTAAKQQQAAIAGAWNVEDEMNSKKDAMVKASQEARKEKEENKTTIGRYNDYLQYLQQEIDAGTYNNGTDPYLMNNTGLSQKIKYLSTSAKEAADKAEEIKSGYENARNASNNKWGSIFDMVESWDEQNEEAILQGWYSAEEQQNADETLFNMQQTRDTRRQETTGRADAFFERFDQDAWMKDWEAADEEGKDMLRGIMYDEIMPDTYGERIQKMTPAQKQQFDAAFDAMFTEAAETDLDWNNYKDEYDSLMKQSKAYTSQVRELETEEKRRNTIEHLTGWARDFEGSATYDQTKVKVNQFSPDEWHEDYYYEPAGTETDKAYYWANNVPRDLSTVDPNEINKYYFIAADRQMLDTFNELYNYDTKTKGQRSNLADQFLTALEPYLNYCMTHYQDNWFRELAEDEVKGPIVRGMSYAIGTVGGVAGKIGSGLALAGVKSAQDPNSKWYISTKMASTVQDQQNENAANTIADLISGWVDPKYREKVRNGVKTGTRFGLGIVDSLAYNFTAKHIGAWITGGNLEKAKGIIQFLMSSEATSNTMIQQLEKKRDPVEAALYAIADGAIEGFTENVNFDKWLTVDYKNMLGNWKALREGIKKAAAGEGIEEINADVLNLGVDILLSAIYGHENVLEEEYNRLVSNGMSTTEASKKVLWDKVKETGASGLAGYISGAAMVGGSYIGTSVSQVQTGRSINNNTSTKNGKSGAQQMIDIGAAMSSNSHSFNIAQSLQNDIDNGKEISDKKLGQLAQALTIETNEKLENITQDTVQQTVKGQLVDAGVESEDAEKYAKIITKDLTTKDGMSKSDKKTLSESEAAINLWKAYNSNDDNGQEVRSILQAEVMDSTQDLRSVLRSVSDIINNNTVSPEIKMQMAGEEDIKDADGKPVEGPKGIVFLDTENGTKKNARLGNLVTDGKTLKYQVYLEGQEQPVLAEPEQIMARTPGTAALLYQQQSVPGFYSQAYTNTMLEAMNNSDVANNPDTLMIDARRIRFAAFRDDAMPQTNLPENVAKTLYQVAQSERTAEREQETRDIERNALKPGEGYVTYNGVRSDEKGFEKVISKLSETDRQTARDVAAFAKAAGLQIGITDNAGIVQQAGTEGEQFEGDPSMLYGAENRSGITVNLEGVNYRRDDSGKLVPTGRHNIGITLGHETVHWLQRNTRSGYDNLANYILNEQKQVLGEQGLNEQIERIMLSKDLDLSHAISELVADSCDNILNNEKVVRHIAETNKGLYKQLKNFVHNLLNKVRNFMLGHEESMSAHSRRLINRDMKRLADLFNEAWDEAVSGELRTETNEEALAKDLQESDGTETHYGDYARFSTAVTDRDELNFLNNQETVTTYKTMQLIDGKLYPPMAAVVAGNLEDASQLGQWEKAVEHPELIKKGNKFTLNKGKGKGSLDAAYNPYMHSSNLMINDQFTGAYDRDNLVTVECEVPVSELTSDYHAQYAKDNTGWHSWHTGPVAGQIRKEKGIERQVMLSRWIKPVRIVDNAEVAAHYAELLNGTDIAVPDNVVPPKLLSELKKAGVKIQESGRLNKNTRLSTAELSDGTRIAIEDENILDQKPDSMRIEEYIFHYLEDHVNDSEISEATSDVIYLGNHLPREYTHSNYTNDLKKGNRKKLTIKERAASVLLDSIVASDNKKGPETAKHNNKDAKLGVYRYTTKIAFPVKNKAGEVTNYNVYSAQMIVNHTSKNRLELYDIIDINKDDQSALKLQNESAHGTIKLIRQPRAAFENKLPQKNQNIKTRLSSADIDQTQHDMLTELQAAKAEMDNQRELFGKFKPEAEKWSTRLYKAHQDGTFDELMPEYKEWEKGYVEARDAYDNARQRYNDLNKAFENYLEERDVAEEQQNIEKSGMTEADFRRKQAIKEFGYTSDFREAGYLLPNGRMLNFTGEKGKHYGIRGEDHRGIGRIYASRQYTGSAAMIRFMNDGNIRVMAETPGVDIASAVEPTADQYATIRSMAQRFEKEEYFSIDFSDQNGDNVGTIEYDGRINPTRIINDIKSYYKTGEVPQQSTVDKYRWSKWTENEMDVDSWMMHATPSQFMTDDELILQSAYKSVKINMDLSLKRQLEYKGQIRKINSKKTLTTEDKDALLKLENKLAIQRKKMAQYEEEMHKIRSDEGFAGMMYRQNMTIGNFIQGKTQQQVQASVDALTEEVKRADKTIAAQEKELAAMEAESAIKTVKRLMNRGMQNKLVKEMKNQFGTSMSTEELKARLAEMVLKSVNDEDIMPDVEALTRDIIRNQTGFANDEAESRLALYRGMTIEVSTEKMAELKAMNVSLKNLRDWTRGSGIRFVEGNTDTLSDNQQDMIKADTSLETVIGVNAKDEIVTGFAKYIQGLLESRQGESAEDLIDEGEVQASILATVQLAQSSETGGMTPAEIKTAVENDAARIRKVLGAVRSVQSSVDLMKQSGNKAQTWAGMLQDDIENAVKYYNRVAQLAAEQERARVKRVVIDQLKNENTKKLVEQQEKFRELLKKDRTARQLATDNLKLRAQITTTTKRLANLLTKETDLKNIPEQAKPLARQMIRMIANHDMDFRMVLLANSRDGLRNINRTLDILDARDGKFTDADLGWLVRGEGENADWEIHDRVVQALIDIETGLMEYTNAEGRGLVSLTDRKAALEKIQEATATISRVIRAQQEVEINGRRMYVDELAMEMLDDMRGGRFKGEWGGWIGNQIGKGKSFVVYGNMTPEYFMKNLKNGTMSYIYDEYHKAENRAGLLYAQAQEAMANIAEEAGYDSWDLDKKHTFELEKGGKVQLNLEQMMQLYATWLREQTLQNEIGSIEKTFHLETTGFYVEQDNSHKIAGRELFRQRSYKVTPADMAHIAASMSMKQINYINQVVEYLTRTMGAIGNEASMKMYGIKKYNEQYYFPFEVWNGVKAVKSDAGAGGNMESARGAHPSFSNRLTNNASNALMMRGFTQTAAKHIVQMINYSTFAPAIETLQRVMNTQLLTGEDENVTPRNMWAAFGETYGKDALTYLQNFQKDINGGATRVDRTFYDRLLSRFRKSAVAGSLSVALQQPMSYIRASMIISPKYLTAAWNPATMTPNKLKATIREMRENSGLAVLKHMGKFDMGIGRSAQQFITPDAKQSKARQAYEWVSNKTTALPEAMDTFTWARIWTAVKMEQQAQNKEMDPNSKEFMDKVVDRFNEVLRMTQVYDSVLVRSANMRSANPINKMLTSFMAEPTLTANVLADAVINVKDAGGKLKLAKACATFILSAIGQALVKGVMGAGRNPDKKKTWNENMAYRFMYNFINEVNPLALLPLYSDLITAMKDGELSDDALGVIGKVFEAVKKGGQLISGKEDDIYRGIEDSVGVIAQLYTNVPVKNLARDARALYNFFTQPYAKRDTNAGVLKYQLANQLVTADNLLGAMNKLLDYKIYDTSSTAYYDRIYNAEKAGNEQAAQDMRDYVILTSKAEDPEKTMGEKLRSLTKKDDSLTPQEKYSQLKEYGLTKGGDFILDEYEAGRLTRKDAEKLYRQENPKKTDKEVLEALDRRDWKNAGNDPEGYSNYTPLYEAIKSNRTLNINQAVDHMMDNGYTQEDIKGQLSKKYKQAYLDAKGADKTKLKDALTKAYKAIGLTANEALAIINGWKPKTN